MSEYKKKVSGVTNILIRDAHGKRKIDHGAWNDELNNDSSESNRRKSRRKRIQINYQLVHSISVSS